MTIQADIELRWIAILFSCLSLSFPVRANSCHEAQAALQRRDAEASERLLKQCLATNPVQLKPYLDLCGLYQAQGRNDDLVRVASEGLKRFPDERRFYVTVGNDAGRKGEYDRAIEVFGQAVGRWPQEQAFRESLADANLYLGMRELDKGDNEKAEHHLREATRLADRDIDARMNLGRALHNLNRSVEAIAEFDRVIALDPKAPLAWFHRGMVRQTLGELDAAIADLSEEIQRNPSYPPSYLVRGRAYFSQARFSEALADLELAVAKMPDNAPAIFTRGRCNQQIGRETEAEADFRRAIELDPENPEPMNTLARLLSLSGRQAEAEELFQKARERSQAIRTARAGEIQFKSLPRRR
jgi:tetratricopeptide (TPR) repeat protein